MSVPVPTTYPPLTQPSVARLDWEAIRRDFLAGQPFCQVMSTHKSQRRPISALLHHHGYQGRVDLRIREAERIRRNVTASDGTVHLDRLTAEDADLIEWFILGEGPNQIRYRDLLNLAIDNQHGTPANDLAARLTNLGIKVTSHFRRTYLEPLGVDLRWSSIRAIPTTEHTSIIEEYEAGKNAVDLAIQHEVDEATIRRILIKHGVERRARGTRSVHGLHRYADAA